ncbi:hypothetical protein FHG87_004368 [Trinorchestia longiramus]|nr:hypothetical protein FHG87_004368 [Trinorchestia longiramus]
MWSCGAKKDAAGVSGHDESMSATVLGVRGEVEVAHCRLEDLLKKRLTLERQLGDLTKTVKQHVPRIDALKKEQRLWSERERQLRADVAQLTDQQLQLTDAAEQHQTRLVQLEHLKEQSVLEFCHTIQETVDEVRQLEALSVNDSGHEAEEVRTLREEVEQLQAALQKEHDTSLHTEDFDYTALHEFRGNLDEINSRLDSELAQRGDSTPSLNY